MPPLVTTPATPIKLVIFFSSGQQGWTETYYLANDTVVGVLANITPDSPFRGPLASFLYGRRTLLSERSFLFRVRASQEGAFRQEDDRDWPASISQGLYPVGGTSIQAEVFSSLLVRVSATTDGGSIVHRSLFMGGLPEDIISPSGSYSPTVLWADRFGAWQARAIEAKVAVKTRIAGLTFQPITLFTPDPIEARTALVNPNVLPNVPGSKGQVVIKGLKAPRGWNGTHTATVQTIPPGPAVAMYIGPVRKAGVDLPLYDVRQGAQVALAGYQYPTVKRFNDERLVEHKRGRPFGEARGRSSRP